MPCGLSLLIFGQIQLEIVLEPPQPNHLYLVDR